ncbi:MAG: hypothetical protein K0Q59_920 [Paenibacillus sp.]|jgi:hypothetical protein|nr:hypothetical protein [Paenibacillus sp.]
MVKIKFESIVIDSLSESSSINTGINVIVGRTSQDELSEAMGSVDGLHNQVCNGQHLFNSKRPFAR